MLSVIEKPTVKLSVCIATFNRSEFIGATLESILGQSASGLEVIVLDGGSTDGTESIVLEYARRFECLRYIRQSSNSGLDRDFDRAVEAASGEYCWLMTDDDLLKTGAVAAVLQALQRDLSLIIVNAEVRTLDMSRVLQHRWLDLKADRVYGPGEMDRLILDTRSILPFIGCVVIKRRIWITRERQRYYGSLFIYMGVIFQEPLPGETLVMTEPVISYRAGNTHTFSARVIEIQYVKWPSLVWSLPLSDSVRRAVCPPEPWKNLHDLIIWRALGFYSLTEYRRWIRPRVRSVLGTLMPAAVGLLPGVIVNALLVLYYSLRDRPRRGAWQPDVLLQALRESHFYFFRNRATFKREL